MKKYILSLIVLAITLFSFNVLAWSPPPAPANGGHIVDLAHKLSDTDLAQLEKKIEAVNAATHNEMGALILPSMDGAAIEDVAQTTFREWGVGKKGLDNGVLIVIAVAERKSRIQTGKGVEGDLPDLKCNDILLHNLNPHLKKGDFYGGLSETFDSISGSVVSHRAGTATTTPSSQSSSCDMSAGPYYDHVFIMLLALGVVAYVIYRQIQARKKETREKVANSARDFNQEIMRQSLVPPDPPSVPRKTLPPNMVAFTFPPPPAPLPPMPGSKSEVKEAVQVMEETKKPMYFPPTSEVKYDPVVDSPKMIIPPPKPVTRTLPSVAPYSTTKSTVREVPVKTSAYDTHRKQQEERRLREDAEADDRKHREDDRRHREEEDRRRRDREEEDRRNSSSSSSSSSWSGFGSSDSGSSGSGFGGGDSGGGGSSSDF